MHTKTLQEILNKECLTVIGLMSGTSADGMDAVLVRISGTGLGLTVRQLAFVSLPYTDSERAEILRLASGRNGGSHDLALFSFWLGHISVRACRAVCGKAGIPPQDVDLVGSHGQTLWHIPVPENYLGMPLTATLQLGEASVMAEALGCPVVSDFRVRDMAAGGLGAPLVPYTEYLLYRSEAQCIGLQNIGGIGNMTVLPRAAAMSDVFAFDTGPGNMIIDRVTEILTEGRAHMDLGGRLAAKGSPSDELLTFLLADPYLAQKPPKTTGREHYGDAFVNALLTKARELSLSDCDILSTVTLFTARTIRDALLNLCRPVPEKLIVGGGGSHNPTLMGMLRNLLPLPVLTNEDLGYDSDAKEAVAFAILANECIRGTCSNMPSVTGARHPVVMGKITL